MPMMPMGRMPGEYTKVGLETEVKIPWETYKKLLLLGPVSIWCLVWIPGWLIWLRVAMQSMSAWRWMTREWWPWASGGGIIWPVLMCFMWWGSAPTWATIYRFWIETVYKRTPEYMPWNPDNGPWSPWAHRQIGDESPPSEQVESETVDVNLITKQPGKRTQNKILPKFPNGQRERAFYRAVGAQMTAFSEGGAAKHKVSQRQFRKIRDALIARKCADWKNKRRHKDGVDLFDSGRGLLKARGQ